MYMNANGNSCPALCSRRRFLQTTAVAALGAGTALDRVQAAETTAGEKRWEFDANAHISSPTVVDNNVYFTASGDGGLYSLDAETGDLRWTVGDRGTKPPIVVDGTVFADVNNSLHAVDTAIGSQQWIADKGRRPETVYDGTVYWANNTLGNDHLDNEGKLHAVDAGTGETKWCLELDERFVLVGQGLTAAHGAMYCITTSGDDDVVSNVRAVDLETGTERWSAALDGVDGKALTVANQTVYVASFEELYAFDAETGETEWSSKRTGVSLRAWPTVADGTIYTSSSGSLYAIDARAGTKQWETEIGESSWGSPTVGGGVVYVTSNDGQLHAIERTGDRKWTFEADNQGYSESPLLVDGVVYFNSDNMLYAVDAGVEGSSVDSRARLGSDGHHDDWADADQQIQIHHQPTGSLGRQKQVMLGAFGAVTGAAITRTHFRNNEPDRDEAERLNDE